MIAPPGPIHRRAKPRQPRLGLTKDNLLRHHTRGACSLPFGAKGLRQENETFRTKYNIA